VNQGGGTYGSERLNDLTSAIEMMTGHLEEDEVARVDKVTRLQDSVRIAMTEQSEAEQQVNTPLPIPRS